MVQKYTALRECCLTKPQTSCFPFQSLIYCLGDGDSCRKDPATDLGIGHREITAKFIPISRCQLKLKNGIPMLSLQNSPEGSFTFCSYQSRFFGIFPCSGSTTNEELKNSSEPFRRTDLMLHYLRDGDSDRKDPAADFRNPLRKESL